MGRSFKLTNRTQYKKKQPKEKEEVKVVYDHRPKLKTNPILISEFKKNMDCPSYLWDGDESMVNHYTENRLKFPDRDQCCVPFNKCICSEY